MGKVLIEEENLTNIANSIRNKTGNSELMTPSEMSGNIDNIEGRLNITDYSYYFYKRARFSQMEEILNSIKKLTNVKYMFSEVAHSTSTKVETSLELDFSNVDTSELTSLESMFMSNGYLLNLKIKNLDVSNVTKMNSCFTSIGGNCAMGMEMLDIDFSNSNNLTNIQAMFKSMSITTLVPKLNTTNVDSLYEVFAYQRETVDLDISGWNLENVKRLDFAFLSMEKLENLKFGTNLGKAIKNTTSNNSFRLDFSKSTLLTHDSLMSVINNVYDLNLTYDVANGGKLYTQQLNFGEENVAKLTEEEIAIATNKGWTIV